MAHNQLEKVLSNYPAAGAEGSLALHTTAKATSPKGYSVFISNSVYRSGNIQKTGSLS